MLTDLGRLIRLLLVCAAVAGGLGLVPRRWRSTLVAVGATGALALLADRLPRRRRPLAPDGWPLAGQPTLALATGDGVWRVELSSGRAFPASPAGQPTVAVSFEGGRLRAGAALAWRETADWRTWAPAGRPLGPPTWRQPAAPPAAGAAGLPRRGDRVLAARTDEGGGHYVGTGPWPAPLAMRLYLAAPDGWSGRLATWLLRQRRGRLYHLDASGTRRLIAAGLPPVFAVAPAPREGRIAGPAVPAEATPRAPSTVGADVAAP